jgi:hypothetical protein
MKTKCGVNNQHWYSDGETCQCGQIPVDIFFSKPCSCGAGHLRKPKHKEDCDYISWAKKRNQFINEHPELKPQIDKVPIRTVLITH